MPLRVSVPTSAVVGAWRPPWWQRIVFPGVGLIMLGGSLWPWPEESSYRPIWIGVVVGMSLVWYGLRPKLVLFEDALYIRGPILSRVIPIEEISAVAGGYGGLDIWWGEGRMSEASAIGEQTNIDGLPGSDRRRHDMRSLILETRDAYLDSHGLTARPNPVEEDERRRKEFERRGWLEHNPPVRGRRDSDQT